VFRSCEEGLGTVGGFAVCLRSGRANRHPAPGWGQRVESVAFSGGSSGGFRSSVDGGAWTRSTPRRCEAKRIRPSASDDSGRDCCEERGSSCGGWVSVVVIVIVVVEQAFIRIANKQRGISFDGFHKVFTTDVVEVPRSKRCCDLVDREQNVVSSHGLKEDDVRDRQVVLEFEQRSRMERCSPRRSLR
jgi:hypothetical protein